MSDRNRLDDEDILLAFAVEPEHDRATLEQYLRLYPHLAEDLADISLDIRLQQAGEGASSPVDETWVEESWAAFQSTMPAPTKVAVSDPFASSGVIQGFSTCLVEIATVPTWIVDAVAKSIQASSSDLRSFMAGSSRLAPGLSYKSAEAPAAAPTKITFEELLVQCKVPEETRRRLLEDRD